MPKVEGIDKVVQKLQALDKEKGKSCSVTVGYTQSYAIYVHENLQAFHPVGQAKYLEQPARLMAKELGKMVSTAVKRGVDLCTALFLSGLRLQRASQELVPVLTGALKNSAFTRVDQS